MESTIETFVPITMFLCLLGGYWLHRHYRFRGQQQIQETLRAALGRGDTLSPETVQAMMPQQDPNADRRKAILSLMLALAMVGFALVIGEQDAIGPLVGLACFPLFLSGAFFWLSRSPGNATRS